MNSLFNGRSEETEVALVVEFEGEGVKTALSLSLGEEVKLSGRAVLQVDSVTPFDDETGKRKASVTLHGRASQQSDGVWDFSGVRIPTGDKTRFSCGSGETDVWILEILPASSSHQSSSGAPAAPTSSSRPIAAAPVS
ncbi:MAG: hypothetical protein IJV00_02115 [Clostridia bacterium]|nr:hypothetical protein [Clostridia bacterium]